MNVSQALAHQFAVLASVRSSRSQKRRTKKVKNALKERREVKITEQKKGE